MKKNKSMRYRKNTSRKTRKQRGGFLDKLFKSSNATNDQIVDQDKKQYGSISGAITDSVKASTKAWNMPAAIAAINTKLNALLVHNKVNYVFSNGYNARDYDISSVEGSRENDGRGVLVPGAKRGVITGFQSKIYNKGTDIYENSKKKSI